MLQSNSLCFEACGGIDGANDVAALLENAWDYNNIFLKFHLTFMFLVISGLLPKLLIDFVSHGKYCAVVSKYAFKEIFWINGASTFTIMYVLQPHNLLPIGARIGTLIGITASYYIENNLVIGSLKYSLLSLLAFIL